MRVFLGSDISFSKFAAAGETKTPGVMAEAAELFRQGDFSVVNLENVFGKAEDGQAMIKSGPNLISDDDFIEYIDVLNPDIVGLANNHTMDYGEGIMLHTMDMLKKRGSTCIGAGENIEEAYRPAKVTKDGITAAIIAVCENEFGIAGEDCSGTAGYSLGRVTKSIMRALKEGCKPIIYFHGGNERNPFPSPGKVELYRHFIDLGAEAVIAMHTHCPQGYEYYRGKPIVYSMGNFYFPTFVKQHKSWFYGYISELELTEAGTTLTVHPYTFDFKRLYLLKGNEKAAFMRYLACLSEPITDAKRIRDLFDSWCMVNHLYVDMLKQYKEGLLTDGKAEEAKHLRNLFVCEAHNEVVKNTMLLAYESRIEAAKAGVDFIRELQEMKGFEKRNGVVR